MSFRNCDCADLEIDNIEHYSRVLAKLEPQDCDIGLDWLNTMLNQSENI